jgi:predicted DNA-binding helix-hairpin-helix protein
MVFKWPLKYIQQGIRQFSDEKALIKSVPKFVPAGQSTQMVIGATPESDKQILHTADSFYKNYSLKRVYYSGYIPISYDSRLPVIGTQPPLIRENRLYQADWLMRFYGFGVNEILDDTNPHLEIDVDPKLSWALRHLEQFPVDVNSADYRMILRVPGIGVSSALKIVQARRFGKLRRENLTKIGISFRKAQHFIRYADSPFQLKDYEPAHLKSIILAESKSKFVRSTQNQLSLF